jgi:drug/metabolite transporter (DMT)-like permease
MRLKANLAADGVLILTTMLWGSTFVVTKDLLEFWPPITYLAVRFVIASFLLILIFRRKFFAARAEEWKAGATLGMLISIGMAIQVTGLIYTTPSKSAFITGLTTPLVPFVALMFFRLRPNLENLIGVVLASIGAALILAPADGAINKGDLISLGSPLLFALHIILMGNYTKRYDMGQLTAMQIVTAMVVMLSVWLSFRFVVWAVPTGAPEFMLRESAPLVWSTPFILQLLYMSTVATLGTFLLWTWAQARMSATHAAIIFSLEPVWATLFAVLVRGSGEWMGGRGTIGAILILCGVIVSEIRLGRSRDKTLAADDQDVSIDPANA